MCVCVCIHIIHIIHIYNHINTYNIIYTYIHIIHTYIYIYIYKISQFSPKIAVTADIFKPGSNRGPGVPCGCYTSLLKSRVTPPPTFFFLPDINCSRVSRFVQHRVGRRQVYRCEYVKQVYSRVAYSSVSYPVRRPAHRLSPRPVFLLQEDFTQL